MGMSRKRVSVICLSFIIIGLTSSSVNREIENPNQSISQDKAKDIAIATIVSNNQLEEAKEDEIQKEEVDEEKRRSEVTYKREDIRILSQITKEEMRNVLNNYNGASTMAHLSDAFVEAEEKHGVNAFVMAAIVALESGFATSRRAVEDNNLTGFEVYADNSEGRLFESQEESILHTARHLEENYLTEGGRYYNGVSVDDVQKYYCPDEGKNKNWEGKVNSLASGFLNKYKELYLE